jgi:hypothetical protein
MKTRMILWLAATAILCFAAFWCGKSQSRPIYLYDQNPLARDRSLLEALRAGYTTNVIVHLEAMLDVEILRAMSNRPAVQGREREILDKTLRSVARYRKQFPRQIQADTNGVPSSLYKQVEPWIIETRTIQ